MATKEELQLFDTLLERKVSPEKAREVIRKGRKEGTIDIMIKNTQGRGLGGTRIESTPAPATETTGTTGTTETQTTQQEAQKPGVLEGLGQDLLERGEKIKSSFNSAPPRKKNVNPFSFEAIKEAAAGGIKPLREATQVVGELAGGAGDIIGTGIMQGAKALGAGISATVPDVIEDPIVGGIKKGSSAVIDSDIGQAGVKALMSGVEAWRKFSEKNPETAHTISSIGNIGSLVAPGSSKVGRTGTDTVLSTIETTGRIVKESGEKTIEKSLRGNIEDMILNRDTKKQKIEQAEGGALESGIFSTKKTANKREAEMIDQVAKIPGLKKSDTTVTKLNKIERAISTKAKELVENLNNNPVIFPRREAKSYLDNLAAEVRNTPTLKGADMGPQVDNVMENLARFIDEQPSTGVGLLQARKNFDAWVRQTGLDPYSGVETPLKVAIKRMRMGVNDFIDIKAKNANVKQLFKEQNLLYEAASRVSPKAIKEAESAVGRLVKAFSDKLGTGLLSKVVAGGALVGAGSAAIVLPTVGAIAAGILGVSVAGKIVLSGKLRQTLGVMLEETSKALKKTPGNPDLQGLKEQIEDMLENSEEAPESQEEQQVPLT